MSLNIAHRCVVTFPGETSLFPKERSIKLPRNRRASVRQATDASVFGLNTVCGYKLERQQKRVDYETVT